jgi:hypothetical protein
VPTTTLSQVPPTSASFAVVIPTRSRPERLGRCLDSIAAARGEADFPVYVCDSSPTEELRAAVRAVCERHPFTRLSTHDGRNASAARNACARAASEPLLISVDDDLEIEAGAFEHLSRRYAEEDGRRVVTGSVYFDGQWSRPVKERSIGYGRPVRAGEEPDFITAAFFLYPRSFALTWPWNERIDREEDIFMGAVWRRHGVSMCFAEEARAVHEELPMSSDPGRLVEMARHQRSHVYCLLFDALVANPSARRALAYETLGFAAGAKLYLRRPRTALAFLGAWAMGHLQLLRDLSFLRRLTRTEPEPDAV